MSKVEALIEQARKRQKVRMEMISELRNLRPDCVKPASFGK